jgi:hypothetical protein
MTGGHRPASPFADGVPLATAICSLRQRAQELVHCVDRWR